MGAVFRLSVQYFNSFDDYARDFPRSFYPLLTDGATELRDARFEPPFSLVFGSEGAGLGEEFANIGTSLAIPHGKHIDSLNLSVAVAIALYESTKPKP